MNYEEAINKIKEGKNVTRKEWNDKKIYIFNFKNSFIRYRENEYFCEEIYDMVELGDEIEIGSFNSEDSFKIEDFLLLKTALNTVIPWNESQADFLADDWEEVTE